MACVGFDCAPMLSYGFSLCRGAWSTIRDRHLSRSKALQLITCHRFWISKSYQSIKLYSDVQQDGQNFWTEDYPKFIEISALYTSTPSGIAPTSFSKYVPFAQSLIQKQEKPSPDNQQSSCTQRSKIIPRHGFKPNVWLTVTSPRKLFVGTRRAAVPFIIICTIPRCSHARTYKRTFSWYASAKAFDAAMAPFFLAAAHSICKGVQASRLVHYDYLMIYS